jgi:hypothetical protein
MRIRDFRPTDLPYLYEICLKTGFSGKDATAQFVDPFMIGQFYAAPYAAFEPRCVLMLEGDRPGFTRPVGYILGTTDTLAFNRWFDREWRPAAAALYPLPPTSGADSPAPGPGFPAPTDVFQKSPVPISLNASSPGPAGAAPDPAHGAPSPAPAPGFEDRIRSLFHKPFEEAPWFAEYPGNLHIDLLPDAQGGGWGRRLMDAWGERLKELGCPGYHLGVGKRNEGGVAFYRKYGMIEVAAPDWGFVFGRRLV